MTVAADHNEPGMGDDHGCIENVIRNEAGSDAMQAFAALFG